MKKATAEYRSEMDIISSFLEECCWRNNGREIIKDLFQSYIKWAKENNEYEMSSRKFGQEMSKHFERQKSNDVYYYYGLKLLDEYRPH